MQKQLFTLEPDAAYAPLQTAEADRVFLPQTTNEANTLAATAQTQAVTSLLTATRRKIRRRKVIFWASFLLMESGMLLDRFIAHFAAWLGFDEQAIHAFVHGVGSPFFLLVVFAGLAGLVSSLCTPLNYNADELARVGGVRAVPALIEALDSGTNPHQRRIICRALTPLLPQMQASDADLLTSGHRRKLNFLLKWGRRYLFDASSDTEFILAVLKAYEQIGDARAIPVVESLANMRGQSERKRKIRQAAQQCLPLLQAHLGELNTTQTLLRSSSAFLSAPDVLLRPATNTDTASADQLLRSADTEAERS